MNNLKRELAPDQASAHPILPIPDDYQEYPHSIAEATRLLRLAGVDGPYAIAMGPRYYTGLTQAVGDGGYPVLNVVRKLVDGPLVWAPAVKGAVVLSLRGGDFELTIGRDLSIAYQSHTDKAVRLYLVETMAFRVLTPEAAVALAHKDGKGSRKGSSRQPRAFFVATMVSAMKSPSTTSCATANGGSVCFGASAVNAGNFRNACVTPTKTLR
jgi:hypothetical protein